MTSLKRLIVISASAGAGFALVICLVYCAWRWNKLRPKPPAPWNEHAIKAELNDVDFSDDHAIFTYILENTTDWDYELTKGSKFDFSWKLKEGKNLTKSDTKEIEGDLPIRIPAKQRITVYVNRLELFKSDDVAKLEMELNKTKLGTEAREAAFKEYKKNLASLFTGPHSGVEAFVLFDYSTRYQINFSLDLPP